MKEYKALIIETDSEERLNRYFRDGWKWVNSTSFVPSAGNNNFCSTKGYILVILEKEIV